MNDLDIIEQLRAKGYGLLQLTEEEFSRQSRSPNGYILKNKTIIKLRLRGEDLIFDSHALKIISKLKYLKNIDLQNNRLRKIPYELSELRSLRNIDLTFNHIEYIQSDLTGYDNLEELIINDNWLQEIDYSIFKLKKLRWLELSRNDIKVLPDEIIELEDLEVLLLNENRIKIIPNNFYNLKKLIFLSFGANEIESIPDNFLLLNSLEKFYFFENPIIKELKEIESLENSPKQLIRFLLSIQNGETKQLNEAKILVLGDERVGKTSIINRIIGNDFEKNQTSTEGIDIQNYHLSNDIKVNIWDFAGQEITHQTHQFFLSTRSLYLFVLDVQKEDNDSDIYDWLEVIKSNAGDSPIIIVVNKVDRNRGYTFDINRYKQDFPNIVDVVYTSAQENTNIEQLIKTIEKSIEELEGVRVVFNKDWFEVKEILENLSEYTDYIEGGEFDKVCEQNNIGVELDQRTLLSLLHQIGTVVRYENRNLHSVQILNPRWVTNAVYKVIRSEFLNDDAILKREYFYEIFKDDKRYKERHYSWIMDLLVQFEVAFRINEDELLIPSRLFNNQPDFDISKFLNGLNLRYSYEGRLKKSVIAQFMVKMSRYLTNKKVPFWKNGVFLERSNCKAVVISNIDKREISVYIDTQNRQGREFLAIIRDKFDEINRNSSVIEEIPLIINNEIVGYEEYEYLVGLEQDGEISVTLKTNTKKRRERFEITKLLDGYTKTDKNIFDYEKLRDDLIEIAMAETKSRNAIYNDSEDETNDRFEKALFNRNYNVTDQSRGGESSSGINAGERDLVIRNSQGIDESVIEAFILKSLDSTMINKHYEKLVQRYDTVGNSVNFVLVYSKTRNFNDLWEKYIEYDGFDDFVDTEDNHSQKNNVKVGTSKYNSMTIYHIFINFYSHGGD